MKVNGGSQILVGVSVAIFRKNGKENDPHIKSKAPVLKVEQIVLHALPDGGVAAPTVDLGPTGDAHLQAMTTVVRRHLVEEFCDKARALGPRPDKTHITLQNIEKLGQFVQARPAQEDCERSASRVGSARPAAVMLRRGTHPHGREVSP